MNDRGTAFWRGLRARIAPAADRTKRRKNGVRRQPIADRPELLESRELLTVTYQGGALLTNVEAQAVYLGSDWSANSSLKAQAQSTDTYLSTLTGGPYMDMLTNAGYGVGRGSASAGAFDNVAINKSVALTDSQIQTDLETMISKGQLQAPDANRLYMVYVEPGVVVQNGSATSQNSFLGYHGAFGYNGSDIHYAVMPAPGSPNPSPSSQGFASTFDELTAVSSHELAEAVTDPNVNYKTLGWYDYQLGGEIGDLTRQTSTISGANGAPYVVQDVVNQNDQVISPSSTQPSPSPSSGLSAPALTANAASSTVAQLSWTAASGAQGYRVYEVVGGQPTLLGTVSSSTTSVQVSGLTPGVSVSFEVEAYNSTSVADSNIATVTMPGSQTTVTAPQLTAQATSSTSVLLSWSGESQAQGYRIYWWNGYQAQLLGTVGSGTTSVTVSGLTPGSGSYFLVEAFNSTSRADSRWVYVATPFYMSVNDAVFGQYAQQQPSSAGIGGANAPAAASAHHSHCARE